MSKKFSDLLVKMPASLAPFGYKEAQDSSGVESPDQTQFEQDFSKLAYLFVQDRAAPLLKYILGFEVVNREEDGSKAIGIFGFKIGHEYYYVPAFFINNQIKGVDLLFNKKTNMFVPLQEDWINHIINRQTIELGGHVDGAKIQRDFENPNFRFMAVPPLYPNPSGESPKVAAAQPIGGTPGNPERLAGTAGTPPSQPVADRSAGVATGDASTPTFALKTNSDLTAPSCTGMGPSPICGIKSAEEGPISFRQAWDRMEEQLSVLLEKDAAFQEAYAGFICKLAHQPLQVEKTGEASDLKTWMQEEGGPKAMSALLGAITTNPKFANAALTFYPTVESIYVNEFSKKAMPVKTAAEIKVTTQVNEYVDGEAKKRLVRDGFTVVDTRPEASKTEVYDIDYVKRFSNPELSGTYQVLLKDGRTTKCWVFLPSSASKEGHAIVVEQDKNMWRVAEPEAIYVRGEPDGITEDAFKDAVEIRDMEFDVPYLLIDEHGHAANPVKLTSVIEDPGHRTRMRVSWLYHDVVRRPRYGRDFSTLKQPERHKKFDKVEEGRYDCSSCCGTQDAEYIELADHRGSIRRSGSTLVLPSNWKALKLHTHKDGDEYCVRNAMDDAFQLGNLVDVGEAMDKKAMQNLTVGSDGREYYFRINHLKPTQPVGYKQAYVELVTRFGLSVDDTERLMKSASDGRTATCLIKYAQGVPSSAFVGVNMPPPREPTAATDPYTGIPMYQSPYEQNQVGTLTGMPPKPNANQYGINIGGEAEMDVGAQALATQAGQAGQKRVFDHSSIGGLSKLYDTGAVLDSYIPELMQSLDRLGRILFLYYWKNEDFAERYGSGDIAEMEDLIRGVFKQFGELVLKLRKKSIDADDANTISMGTEQ